MVTELGSRLLSLVATGAAITCLLAGLGVSAQTTTTAPPSYEDPSSNFNNPQYPSPPSPAQKTDDDDDDDDDDEPSKWWLLLLLLLLLPCLCCCFLTAYLLRRRKRQKAHKTEKMTTSVASQEATSSAPIRVANQGYSPTGGKHVEHLGPHAIQVANSTGTAAGGQVFEKPAFGRPAGTYQSMEENYKASGGPHEASRPAQRVHGSSGVAHQAFRPGKANDVTPGVGTYGQLVAGGNAPGTYPNVMEPTAQATRYGTTGQQLPPQGGLHMPGI